MVREEAFEETEAYRCEACGFHYTEEEDAERCEAFCTEHGSCSGDITEQALERQD